jgi:hypothetical protein
MHIFSIKITYLVASNLAMNDLSSVAESNTKEDLSQTVIQVLGRDRLAALSTRQAQLMDEMLEDRLQDRPDPVTEMELLGMYEMITEEVLPVSLPI